MKRVISEIQKHYKKAGIDLKSVKSLEYDINKLYTNYRNMTRHKNRKSNIEWCLKTMPLWPKGTEEKMKQRCQSNFLSEQEKEMLQLDLKFLIDMKNERTATYGKKYVTNFRRLIKKSRREERRASDLTTLPFYDNDQTNFDNVSSNESSDTEFQCTSTYNQRVHRVKPKAVQVLKLDRDFV